MNWSAGLIGGDVVDDKRRIYGPKRRMKEEFLLFMECHFQVNSLLVFVSTVFARADGEWLFVQDNVIGGSSRIGGATSVNY